MSFQNGFQTVERFVDPSPQSSRPQMIVGAILRVIGIALCGVSVFVIGGTGTIVVGLLLALWWLLNLFGIALLIRDDRGKNGSDYS
jgi:hypothetical protein